MTIHSDYSIGDLFTWKVDVKAKYYCRIEKLEDLHHLRTSSEYKETNNFYVLGGGSNTLFSSAFFDGMVVGIHNRGIHKIHEEEGYELWRVSSGENWTDLVRHMVVDLNLGGLENLAYIPGTVGAAPIQNIGAYGQAFEEVCEEVEIVYIESGEHKVFKRSECEFSYRSSIFKNKLVNKKDRFIVWSVTLRLAKPINHSIQDSYYSKYESLNAELSLSQGKTLTIQDMYHAVVSLRKKKLPEVADVGTSGSLFVNPIVLGSTVIELLKSFPALQYYPADKMQYPKNEVNKIDANLRYKIATGHILEVLGWKGRRIGQVGTWDNHALVLCNYGTRNPEDILKVIQMMQNDFMIATGITLVPEIRIVG